MSRSITSKVFLVGALLLPSVSGAAAPTLSAYQQSSFSDSTAGDEVTPSISWSSGDLIVVLGVAPDNSNSLDTPTATGLTFSAVPGTPTNTANNVKLYAWTATAGGSGSSAITATTVSDSISTARGIAAWAFSGSGGIGNKAIANGLGSTTTQSLTRSQANSAVVQIWGDWDAINDTTVTWTPAGQTERVATFVTGVSTFFVADWGDQGSTGTTAYGFTAGSATAMSAITLEVLGSGGGGGGGSTARMLTLMGVGQ